jgi:hypothetical protein
MFCNSLRRIGWHTNYFNIFSVAAALNPWVKLAALLGL